MNTMIGKQAILKCSVTLFTEKCGSSWVWVSVQKH